MSKTVPLNRTGTRAVLTRLQEMLDTEELVTNDTPAPGPTGDDMRRECIEEAEAVGSHTDVLTDPARSMLLDSLGGRLAYERGGARLYDALLRKAEAVGHLQGLKECIPDLEHIRDEEVEHAALLKRVIEQMDGDPTLETPCADIEGVMSSGLLQVVHDPRSTLLECLRCAVVAELADVENWTALTAKLPTSLPDDLAGEVAEALAHEQEHLTLVRKWIAHAEEPPSARTAVRTQAKKGRA
jgi:rubrerythrin